MSRASIARRLVKEAAPHFSVLKVFLKNLRKGKGFDEARDAAFDSADSTLLRGVKGRRLASRDVVEAAGFDPKNPAYHGTNAFINRFITKPGDLGVHVASKPMTSVERGYYGGTLQPQGFSMSDALGISKDFVSMEDLLRSFYNLGKSAPSRKNIAKWFEGLPRPFSHEAMSKYDFEKLRSIDPRKLGVDFNIYPLLPKKGLKTLKMPDVGRWHRPEAVVERLSDVSQGQGRISDIAQPGLEKINFPAAARFYDKHKTELENLISREHGNVWATDKAGPLAARLKDIFKKEGIEAIEYPNFLEGTGELSRVFLDPAKDLRSTYAAFKGGSGLLAGLLPLISMLRGQREE